MAKQNILVGASANDKAGDTLRNAFVKVNANFTELYTLTGGTAADLQELAQDYAAPLFNHASHTNITVTYDDANNKILLTGVASAVWPVTNTAGANGPTRIAIGNSAGDIAQGNATVAVGSYAGNDTQGGAAVAIGTYAGTTTQRNDAIAIGYLTGNDVQGTGAVSIGRQAGQTNQGAYSIAIGKLAGQTNQAANTIILNALNAPLNGVSAQTNSFYVNPIRTDATPGNVLFYNTTTKEITYGAASSVSSLVNGAYTVSLGSTGKLTLSTAGIVRSGTDTAQVGYQAVFTQDIYGSTTTGAVSGMTLVDVGSNAQLLALIDVNSPLSGSRYNLLSPLTITYSDATTQTFTTIRSTNIVTGSVAGFGQDVTTAGHNFPITVTSANYAAATTAPEWTFGANGRTTFPTGLTLWAPRGPNTVNFTSAIDKEFQIETGTANYSKLWRFETNGNTTLPTGLTFRKNGTPYSTITVDLDKVLQIETQTSGGVKQWSFGTDGKLTAPGNLQVDGGKIILNTGGNAYVESVDYGVNSANSAVNIFGGPYQKIKLRAGFGTEATWTFGTNGSFKLPNNSELRPSTAAYDSALASWEYIRSGEITDRITNSLATSAGWPMVDWHPTGLTAQGYIDFLLNAWTVQNTLGGTLIVYPAMSSSFYQQMRTILINIRDNYSLTSSGVSISSGYAKSWNFNEDGKLTFPDGTSQNGAGVQSIHGSLTTANAGGYTVTRNGLTVSIVWDNTSGVAGIIKIAFDSNTMVTERTVTLRTSSQVNSSYIGTNTALTANQAYTIATLTNLGDFSTTHIITGSYNIYRITAVLQQADAPGGNPVAAGYATIEQLR